MDSRYKTGFIGFIIAAVSFKNIYNEYVLTGKLDYISTYKYSQDHLELFFSIIRSRLGYNNNPTARQFIKSYQQILFNKHIQASKSSNCAEFEECEANIIEAKDFGTVGISAEDDTNESDDDTVEPFQLFTISKITDINPTLQIESLAIQLNDFMSATVGYISGFVQKQIIENNDCQHCKSKLLEGKTERSKLIETKEWGKLTYPNVELYNICMIVEKLLKSETIYTQQSMKIFVLKAVRIAVEKKFFQKMSCNDRIDFKNNTNHQYRLVKNIVEIYTRIRQFHELRKMTLNNKRQFLRNKHTKLVLFSNQ